MSEFAYHPAMAALSLSRRVSIFPQSASAPAKASCPDPETCSSDVETNETQTSNLLATCTAMIHLAKTIWLFTRSDLKTILVPSMFFATTSALAEHDLPSLSSMSNYQTAAYRAGMTGLWIWINLLPFNIDNQRQPDSINEDLENKPWRPLPAGMISVSSATKLMLSCHALAVLSSLMFGGFVQCIGLICLGFWYNNLKGADCSFIVRNLINGSGYICFLSGATEVMLQKPFILNGSRLSSWIILVGVVIFTSIQIQDLPDQVGDSLRNRKTVPLVLGDGFARWTIALALAIWSIYCPIYWNVNSFSFGTLAIIGASVACRAIIQRTVDADKLTFKIYNLWVLYLFALPLMQRQDP